MEPLLQLTTVISGINAILIISLIAVYIRNLRTIHSSLTLGLLIFAGLFLVENSVSILSYLTMTPYFESSILGYVFTQKILQTLAFITLNWITYR